MNVTPTKILLLENDPVDIMAFKRHVEKTELPYKVEAVTSIQKALEKINDSSFDVIILDYHLDDGTGMDALSVIKEIPSIFITGSGSEMIAVQALKSGAVDYIIKDMERNYLNLIPATIENALKVKRNEEKLAVYAMELERGNHELEKFTYIASHDLKEPLRKISSFSELLKSTMSDRMSDSEKAYLDKMILSAKRMELLINDLLELSRIKNKNHPFEEVNLKDVASGVLTDLEKLIADTYGTVNIDNLPTIKAVPIQMHQLFQNIISNSLKYHRKDNPPIIKINSRKIKLNRWEIVIKDNGIGFDQKYAEKVFLPFERLHGKGQFEGTGIGLTICQKIIANHSGSIIFESQPDKGTKVIITLPENN